VLTAVAGLTLLAGACGGSPAPSASPSPAATVTPVVIPSPTAGSAISAAQAGDLRQFLAVVAAAGLQDKLTEQGPWTLFAPNQRALASIKLNDLLTNPERLGQIVAYHLVPSVDISLDTAENGQQFTTAEGSAVTITYDGGARLVDGATIVSALSGANWTVYVIDKVLAPPPVAPSAAP
jgi:uncharacterized surface protein with fasciclin (FAS1) repeats